MRRAEIRSDALSKGTTVIIWSRFGRGEAFGYNGKSRRKNIAYKIKKLLQNFNKLVIIKKVYMWRVVIIGSRAVLKTVVPKGI